MKYLQKIGITLGLVALAGGLLVAFPGDAGAINVDPCQSVQSEACNGPTDIQQVFGTVADILLFLVGAISVIIIIFAGIMYVTSAGDPGKAKKAKDTILYAVVGLAVAIFAYAIVKFTIAAARGENPLGGSGGSSQESGNSGNNSNNNNNSGNGNNGNNNSGNGNNTGGGNTQPPDNNN